MKRSIIVIMLILVTSNGYATSFRELSQSYCKEIEWELMYAIALQESGKYLGKGVIAATPYTFNSPDGPRYLKSKQEAKTYLKDLLSRYENFEIDVGTMQLNLKWNNHRVDDLMTLIEPSTNLKVACEVVKESLRSTKDIVLGIGRYHSWNEERSRRYGTRVLKMWKNIKRFYAESGVVQ